MGWGPLVRDIRIHRFAGHHEGILEPSGADRARPRAFASPSTGFSTERTAPIGFPLTGRAEPGWGDMRILGVSCDYHDAAAALVVDGEVVAAAEEERFSRRVKHDSGLPTNAVASVLAIGGIEADEVDAVVLHEKPLGVFSRVLAARRRRGPERWAPSAARCRSFCDATS